MKDTPRAGATSQFRIRIEDKTHIGADGTRLTAIRDFSLDLRPESMTVLMGPSGCGKTTLLRIVAHLDDHYSGEIEIPRDARLGFMFQEPRLLPWRTVRQNIELVAAPGFSQDNLDRLAHAVGIADMMQ
ncbi:MAG: ATP-binding cassette domain-containing protein, partial [Methyloceanibacter sp.]